MTNSTNAASNARTLNSSSLGKSRSSWHWIHNS